MRISTMACHALHLLLCLSEQDDDIPASASELAVCTGISEKFVQKIMRLLQSEGIVKSVRGIAGGHMLARTPDEITLADIIIAVEGGISLPGVSNVAPRGKTALDAWDMVARSMNSSLEAVTLSSVRQSSASAPRQATRRRVAQPSSPLLPETYFGGTNAKAYSLGRQRCRKPKQTVPNPSAV